MSRRPCTTPCSRAHLAVIDYVKPGVVCSDVDKVARDIIEKDYPGTFGHGLGHGVGFEIHEWPRFGRGDSTLAAEGMVVTDEPGIYLPAKYGVRIEDMLLVTADGCRSLTKFPQGAHLPVKGGNSQEMACIPGKNPVQ